MTALELRQREDAFRERRRRLLRAQAALLAVFVAGLALLAGAQRIAPSASDDLVPPFVLGVAAGFLHLWLTLRRHWRCPACDARWQLDETLASAQWNHCAHCGASLRAHPDQRDRERVAQTEFALRTVSDEELIAGFLRRRRWGAVAAGAAALLGLVALGIAQSRGWSELAQNAVGATFGAVAVGAFVQAARCPRCRGGIVAGKRSHCQRCGLRLRRDLDLTRSGP